jgi:hypothetical protein
MEMREVIYARRESFIDQTICSENSGFILAGKVFGIFFGIFLRAWVILE